MKPGGLRCRPRLQDRLHRQLSHAHIHPFCARLRFAHADAGKRRIDEHAIRHHPPGGRFTTASQVIADDAKIVERRVCELRTSRALADRPSVWRRRLKAVIHLDIAAVRQGDAGLFEAYAPGIGCTAGRNQYVGAFDRSRTIRRANAGANMLAASTFHLRDLGG
jgi:hypothetical protein